MPVGQKLISKLKLPTGEVSLFADLLISRFLMGNRSYLFFPLRAFKCSVEAERSGTNFTKYNLWSMANRLHLGLTFLHSVYYGTSTILTTANSVVSEESTDCGQNNDALMVLPGLSCGKEVKPCISISMN